MGNIIEELKRLFRQNGIPVFGIAESKLLENEPEGYKPSDVLSSASSILCFGIPVPKGVLRDQKRVNKNYWRMAETTGLGKIGKNGLIFHSLYGPRLMLGGIVTTASLPTLTWPERDDTGCPADCFVCQDICPAGAIDRIGKVDKPACVKYSMQSPFLSFMMKSKEYKVEDIASIFNTASVDGNAMYTCTKCISACPKGYR